MGRWAAGAKTFRARAMKAAQNLVSGARGRGGHPIGDAQLPTAMGLHTAATASLITPLNNPAGLSLARSADLPSEELVTWFTLKWRAATVHRSRACAGGWARLWTVAAQQAGWRGRRQSAQSAYYSLSLAK